MPGKTKKNSSGGHGRQIWIDGEFVPWADATVHILSHSLQRGSLVFDYMSVYEVADSRGPCIFRLPEHLERFVRSCELVGFEVGMNLQQMSEAICETVRANPGATAVKINAYVPSIEIDVVPSDARMQIAIAAYDPRADITAHKPPSAPKPEMVRLWVEKEKHNRREDIVSPQAKVAANYVHAMTAKLAARRAGYDEILLVDEDGMVAEGPTTNIFIVDNKGVLRTPPERRVLLGVTRSSIIDIAKHRGLAVQEVVFAPDELMAAAEVFMTGTTAGVWPVKSIDEIEIGEGRPGPVSLALREHFERITRGEDDAFSHWLTSVADNGRTS